MSSAAPRLTPVVLSGGAGTRLWPLSRELHPKQLLPLTSSGTMLQETVRRLAGLALAAPIVVCNDAHRFIVAEQLRAIGMAAQAIVLEPVGRNTAPAIALAALAALAGTGGAGPGAAADDVLLLVLPADHVIRDLGAFHTAVRSAAAAARRGQLVTFGVVPHSPETGYGYIQRGAALAEGWRIARFVEKPERGRAEEFLASGGYYWNSGMFVFGARKYLDELRRLAPDIAAACEQAYASAQRDLDFSRIDAAAFAACRSESIDYAVLERTGDAVVVPLDAGWSDVGSWASLHAACEADANGNVIRGDVLAEETHDSYLHAESRLVAVVGLNDHVVVETKDAVLVAPRGRVQDVKSLVARIRQAGRSEHMLHREVFRPWGSYDSLDSGERFQVKRLTVRPGGVLSLQLHHHRAEHWVVVSGTARIT
ncbi:MAG: mannose-1-phosphate guanylyltransferase/mannose-6-phosphate isomerase, partial [Gammaproteobacteria bacterium]|nr:mannose-1-phosphate guanylyltransferase/mannose-6-phosphate isomerase [Gammaproteobacteria bacterium]